MFLRSTVGAGIGPWQRWLLPPDLAAPAAGCFRFELAHVRVLSIVGFSRYQTKIYGTRQLVHWLQLCSVAGRRRLGPPRRGPARRLDGEERLDLPALPNRRGSWRHRRVGPCGSYDDSARYWRRGRPAPGGAAQPARPLPGASPGWRVRGSWGRGSWPAQRRSSWRKAAGLET
jgi:hypothetical protein